LLEEREIVNVADSKSLNDSLFMQWLKNSPNSQCFWERRKRWMHHERIHIVSVEIFQGSVKRLLHLKRRGIYQLKTWEREQNIKRPNNSK
jgi:hypothetical protein